MKESTKVVLPLVLLFVLLIIGICVKTFDYSNVLTKKMHQSQTKQSRSQEIRYVPTQCSGGGDNHIYVAISRTVFKIELNENFNLKNLTRASLESQNKFPIPIDTGESEGCYKNPIQVWKFDHAEIGTVRGQIAFSFESTYEKLFEQVKSNISKDKGSCTIEEKDSRFEVCDPRDRSQSEWFSHPIYRADSSKYVAPNGNAFMVFCNYVPHYNCKIDYDVSDKFHVSVNFDIKAWPIYRVIDSDIKRRVKYNSMIVRDYPWRN